MHDMQQYFLNNGDNAHAVDMQIEIEIAIVLVPLLQLQLSVISQIPLVTF